MLAAAVLVPVLALAVPPGSAFAIPPYVVALLGKYLCYALLALALDLVWGYCGILSLGHGAFFALGGYAMGMYLMRQIGARGVYANPILPDFMVFLNWKELPVPLVGVQLLSLCDGDGHAGSRRSRLRVRLVRVPLAGHRRLSLDHHAGADLCAEARVLPQRFRLWRQQRPDRLQGYRRLQRAGGGDEGGAVLDLGGRAGRRVRARQGDRDVEIRQGADRGARRREPGALPRLPRRELQVVRLGRLGGDRRDRRGALCAAGRHHQPVGIRSGQFDRGGDLGGGRRARHAGWRGARRGGGQFRQDLFHRRLPRILAVRPRRAVRAGDAVPAQGHPRLARRPAPRPTQAPPASLAEQSEIAEQGGSAQ